MYIYNNIDKSRAQRASNGKLPMTEDKGHLFVVCIVMAVVHMIYVTGFAKTIPNSRFSILRITNVKY